MCLQQTTTAVSAWGHNTYMKTVASGSFDVVVLIGFWMLSKSKTDLDDSFTFLSRFMLVSSDKFGSS